VAITSLILSAALYAGCSQFDKAALFPITPEMTGPLYPMEGATVSSGDALTVKFTNHPDLTTTAFIEHDGSVFLPLIGNVTVAGKTTREIHAELVEFYQKHLRALDIVISTEKPDAFVYVAGEVQNSGTLPFRTSMTVAQAVAAATPNLISGDIKSTILVRKDANNPEQYASYLVDADFAAGVGRNVYVAPGDVMIVPRKGIALAGDAVQMYIRNLIPANMGVSYGFVHEVKRISDNAGLSW
jgi:polysaccharide export outer membrane protein